MKNPFRGKVSAMKIRRGIKWILVWDQPEFGISASIMNQEQAKYAAHAINQHDKLVAVLTMVDELAIIHTDVFAHVGANISSLLAEENQ